MAPGPDRPAVDKLTVWQRDAQKLVEAVEGVAVQLPPIDLADADRSLAWQHAGAGSWAQTGIQTTAKISGGRPPVRRPEEIVVVLFDALHVVRNRAHR
jgi:hypothetical protein